MPDESREKTLSPDQIMQIGTGFFPAKTLLSAIKMGLFTQLSGGPRSAGEIRQALGLHERSLLDFLDALVAMGVLEREGLGESAIYRNSPEADRFLDRNKPDYVGGVLEMANDRLYPYWSDLETALRNGEPQNEVKHEGVDLFEKLYEDPDRLEQFVAAMGGHQLGAFRALAESFDFSRYHTLGDVGGASGTLSIEVARRQPHMRCITLDLPRVEPLARREIEQAGLRDRIETRSIDFWNDPFPEADVIAMGNILHDWGLEEKKRLIAKAFDALQEGGALIVIEAMIDDQRRENLFGLLMSLNMLIETREGFNFSGAEFDQWTREAGFSRSELLPLAGPTSAAVAYK